MYDIVSNKKNGLDVDRFDYLHWDALYLNIKQDAFNCQKLIDNSRVIDNQICYNFEI